MRLRLVIEFQSMNQPANSLLNYPKMSHAKVARDAKASVKILPCGLCELSVRLFQQAVSELRVKITGCWLLSKVEG